MWTKLFLLAVGLAAALGQDACDSSNPPQEITASGATVSSPGFATGDDYPSNSLCEWVVTAPFETDTVSLNFGTFVTEDCTDCGCDYLELYDGADDTAPFIGRYCGNHNGGRISGGNVVYMKFVSDGSVNGPGFTASVDFSDTACEGGMTITDRSGSFNSPNFPATYPDNSNCFWRIRSNDPDNRVQISLNAFSLETGCGGLFGAVYDTLSFTDNSDLSRMGYWYGALDGSETFTYTSYSNDATIAFHSDVSVGSSGFNVSYSIVPKSS